MFPEDIRIERVQDITDADCGAEGIELRNFRQGAGFIEFRKLWDSINLKRGFGWESNPFVWVVTFKVVNP